MITIKSNVESGVRPKSYSIEGHAGYAPIGQDIVCSGVSALHYSFINYLRNSGIEYSISESPDYVRVCVDDDSAHDCLSMVIQGFCMISASYPDNVRVLSQ